MRDLLKERVEAAVNRAIAQSVEAAVEVAIQDLRQRIRKDIAQIATTVTDEYSVERNGRDLVVRVRIEEKENA